MHMPRIRRESPISMSGSMQQSKRTPTPNEHATILRDTKLCTKRVIPTRNLISSQSSNSRHNLLAFLHDLLHDLFDDLILALISLLDKALSRVGGQSQHLSLLRNLFLNRVSPREPLIQQSASVLNNCQVSGGATVSVLNIEDLAVFTEVLANLLLLFFGEECGWTRTPEPLLEFFDRLFAKLLALEVVQVITILHLFCN